MSAYLTLIPLILISEGFCKTKNQWCAHIAFRIKNPKPTLAFEIYVNYFNSSRQ